MLSFPPVRDLEASFCLGLVSGFGFFDNLIVLNGSADEFIVRRFKLSRNIRACKAIAGAEAQTSRFWQLKVGT